MIKVTFVINSNRKLSSYAKEVLSLAGKSSSLQLKILYTKSNKHAIVLAEEASGFSDVIIAVGGDGTCNEVLNGIYNSGVKDLILGIIPTGTGNDFSKMLKLATPIDLIKKIEEKTSVKIDIGEVVFDNSKSVFINIADIGFGVKVVDLMNKQRSMGVNGKISYATAIIRSFFSYKKIQVSIKADGFSHQGKVFMAVFCNGTTFGHGIVINPEANLQSGKLEVTIIGNVSILTYLKYLGKLKRGEKINHPQVHYYQIENVKLGDFKKTEQIEGDGEILGSDIQEVNVIKNGISLIN